MNRSLLLLAAFTVAVIAAAYGLHMEGLEFIAGISGVVFLIKCCQSINSERDEKEALVERGSPRSRSD